MKKLIIILAVLFVGFSASAQLKQFRVIYTQTFTPGPPEKPGVWKESQNTFFFNYGGKAQVKIYKSDNSTELFTLTSEIEYGATGSGIQYQGATYVGENGDEVYIQYFTDKQYGIRIIFDDNSSLEFRS